MLGMISSEAAGSSDDGTGAEGKLPGTARRASSNEGGGERGLPVSVSSRISGGGASTRCVRSPAAGGEVFVEKGGT